MLHEANLFESPPRCTIPGWEWTTAPQGKGKPNKARQRALKAQLEAQRYGYTPPLERRLADLAESRLADQLEATKACLEHTYWMKDFFRILDELDALQAESNSFECGNEKLPTDDFLKVHNGIVFAFKS